MDFLKKALTLRQDLSTRFKWQRIYKRKEDPYNYRGSSYEHIRFEEMRAFLEDRTYECALEMGCGEGESTRRLAPLCQRLVALDISSLALERAKKTLSFPHVEWISANMRNWETNDSFDLVILGDVIYYLGDPAEGEVFDESFDIFSRKVVGWLRPFGRLLLAHCFGNERDLLIREDYGRRFEQQGLRMVARQIAGQNPHDKGELHCILQLLEKSTP